MICRRVLLVQRRQYSAQVPLGKVHCSSSLQVNFFRWTRASFSNQVLPVDKSLSCCLLRVSNDWLMSYGYFLAKNVEDTPQEFMLTLAQLTCDAHLYLLYLFERQPQQWLGKKNIRNHLPLVTGRLCIECALFICSKWKYTAGRLKYIVRIVCVKLSRSYLIGMHRCDCSKTARKIAHKLLDEMERGVVVSNWKRDK